MASVSVEGAQGGNEVFDANDAEYRTQLLLAHILQARRGTPRASLS